MCLYTKGFQKKVIITLNNGFRFFQITLQEKNEYGAEVRRDGRPLPVEFLLVDVPTGMPLQPITTFTVVEDLNISFPIENRESIGEHQVSNYYYK